MCGYVLVLTDPVKLAGAEMIAADQAILADVLLILRCSRVTVIDHEKRLLSFIMKQMFCLSRE